MAKGNEKPTELKCEEKFCLSLTEVSYSFGISGETILEIIDEGIIVAQKDKNDEWLFDGEAIRCIRTVLRLNRDLGVNWAGAGLALELLKEVERLQTLLEQK
ncbi:MULTISPECIES: chaperone modulator CbpM [unclassified Legionella]|uniref:chaperone modulator CbpM n=1 Tax=unclassified Legionella TaxID=2622702 RepID=UPI001056D276|nr:MULTISPECIES: chaperone modulator CbpM [unclassified Legionella]MDI9817918.1 chaperone modulator CbpM [Legionella sp. PL877]